MRMFEHCDNWVECKKYATHVIKSLYHGCVFAMCEKCAEHIQFDFASNIEVEEKRPKRE